MERAESSYLQFASRLYENRDKLVIFDDCDSVFADELALNILKAALDSGKTRKICWNSDSRLLREEGIPNTFNFNGSAIFITNLKFDNVRSTKIKDHLEALMSRCHYIDLEIFLPNNFHQIFNFTWSTNDQYVF